MSLLRTLAGISALTFLSRVTGLVREVLLARYFGASAYTDIFFIAFRIPNLFRRLFAEGSFSQAFVPILSEYKKKYTAKQALNFASLAGSSLFWILSFFTLVGIFFAPFLVRLIASGLAPDTPAFEHAVNLTRIMFPYIFFMSITALMSGVLNTWGEYRHPAFVPVLLNLSFILALLSLTSFFKVPVYALAVGVVVGGILQYCWLVWVMQKMNLSLRLDLSPAQSFQDRGVLRLLRQIVPTLFAVSVGQVSLFINTNIASHLAVGSVSWLNYADRIMEFPSALLGVALSTLLLPKLAGAGREAYSQMLDWGIRLVLLLALPATIALGTLAEPMTATLFQYGRFSPRDMAMTAQALMGYGVGLWALIVLKILSSAFYSQQDLRTPVIAAVIALVSTQLCNIVVVPWLGHAGLALSISVGAIINCAILAGFLLKTKIYRPQPKWFLFVLRLSIALIIFASLSAYLERSFDWVLLGAQPLWRGIVFSGIVGASGVTYFVALWLLGFRLQDFKYS